MSDDPNDKIGTEVSGVVTNYWPSEGKNDPHALYVKGYDQKFTTFDDDTAEPIEEGIEVAFRVERNDQYWNIKDGTVAVVDSDPDTGDDTAGNGNIRTSEGVVKNGDSDDGDSELFESPRDRSIRCNVALKQARELCQPLMHEDVSEARVREIQDTVLDTADVFADKLRELNHRQGGQ